MSRSRVVTGLLPVLLALALGAGCKGPASRPAVEPPPPEFQANEIAYVDSEAFDAIFETALVNQDPVIIVGTGFSKPDWGPRLNAWIAAWNMGGNLSGRTSRGQSPIPSLAIDGDSIREFRLLVNGLMDRVDGVAREGSAWWIEERTRSRRVAMLKPYNLRFHLNEEGIIQLVFFNGNYARYYPGYVQKLTRFADEAEPSTRTVECSLCRRWRDGLGKNATGRLTGSSAED